MTNDTLASAAWPSRSGGGSLELRDIRVTATTGGREIAILDGVDLSILRGRTTGLIGESGSGKSMLASTIIGLLPEGTRVTGSIEFDGQQLVGLPERRRRALRGSRIAMIFQDPLASLNPTQRIGRQVGELLRRGGLRAQGLRDAVVQLLERAGIPDPARRARAYPHQLSGGLRQRAMIAMALAGRPSLLLADEATTALDVTVQGRILKLLRDLQRDEGLSMLFVSHDLRVISHISDDLVVLYAGRVCESGETREVLRMPLHPYTKALAESIPAVHSRTAISAPLAGAPASPAHRPPGCAFHPRCPLATEICRVERPPLREVVPGRRSACHHAEELLT